MSGMSLLDPGQVTKEVYDPINHALQVNVVATTSTGEIVQIASGDGSGDKALVTPAGALQVDASGTIQPVSGTVTVVQPTGTNLHTVVDASALPTGASTSANQTTANTSLSSILANQTNGTQETQVTNFPASQVVSQATGTNLHAVIDSGSISVSNFPATQPVSGTVAATQSGVWDITDISGVVSLPTGASTSALQTSGNASLTSIATHQTDGTQQTQVSNFPASQVVSQPTGTNLHTVVDSSTLPTGASTAAKQPALGTAGTASSDVITVQGVASMTPLLVDASSTIQPISGTVTVTQATGTNLHAVVDSSALPTGASTSALQTTGNTSLASILANQTNGTQVVSSKAITPAALTVTQAAITVGTTAVRLTVSGSAPASTRVLLAATPDNTSTASFYIGSSTVTNSGATRGFQIVGGQPFIANNDAGDYWIVSSVAAQTCYLIEQS